MYIEQPIDQIKLIEDARPYILRNINFWTYFVKHTCRLEANRDSLIFIRGLVKGSTRWAIAAITEKGSSGQFAMNASVLSGFRGPTASLGFQRSEYSEMSLARKESPSGSVVGRDQENAQDLQGIPQGQCFFIRYFKAVKREWLFRMKEAAEPKDPYSGRPGDDEDMLASTSIASSALDSGEELEIMEGPDEDSKVRKW